MTKALKIAAILATIGATASATTMTNCYWIGSTYTCTSMNGGTTKTTRCFTIGNTVSCSSF